MQLILSDVKSNKDKALVGLTQAFDGVTLDSLLVSSIEIQDAIKSVSEDLKRAIQLAKTNIERFHMSQKEESIIVETTEGVTCWRKSIAIEKVVLYIPGGSAPLFSTILML